MVLLNKIKITAYFENLTVEIHVLYAPNTHVKFCVNKILTYKCLLCNNYSLLLAKILIEFLVKMVFEPKSIIRSNYYKRYPYSLLHFFKVKYWH